MLPRPGLSILGALGQRLAQPFTHDHDFARGLQLGGGGDDWRALFSFQVFEDVRRAVFVRSEESCRPVEQCERLVPAPARYTSDPPPRAPG